jgi:hypothetical protein
MGVFLIMNAQHTKWGIAHMHYLRAVLSSYMFLNLHFLMGLFTGATKFVI